MALTQGYRERRTGGSSPYVALSVAFIFVLSLQLLRSIVIDTYSLIGTRLDLAGFAICHVIGAMLILPAAKSRRLMADVPLLCILLIIYITIIVATTSPDTSILALLLSRFGILNWFLLGLGTAAAASYSYLPTGSTWAKPQRRLFMLASGIIGILIASYSLNYLRDPVYSPFYQSVSDTLIAVLLIFMILTQVVWDGKIPILVVIGVLFIGTLVVTATARMQSTSIVGFWSVGLVVYFWRALSKLSVGSKVLVFAAVVGGTIAYLTSDVFNQILAKTRFAEVLAGGHLSSIDGRLALWSDFGRQFSISPVFGNFSAEVLAGSGVGNYPHTLLSFLTHTGVIGTALLGLVLFLIFSRRLPMRLLRQPDLQQFLFMGAVLALGTAYTFMTWSVFWFMLGFMCKMPKLRAPRATR